MYQIVELGVDFRSLLKRTGDAAKRTGDLDIATFMALVLPDSTAHGTQSMTVLALHRLPQN